MALLLVLDNCEQVADGVAMLADSVLQRSPRVHLLATSRVPLGVKGEQLFDCQPLAKLLLAAGQPADAARLFGFTHAQVRRFGPDATNALMRRYDADLARIAGEVGSQRLAEAWNAGAAVPWAEMLAELGTAGAAWQPPHQAVAPTVSSIQS